MARYFWLALLLPTCCHGHGHMTYPPSTRHGGSMAKGNNCDSGACYWFTNNQKIPGEPTLNDAWIRSVNINVSSGALDWTRQHPWRAPGMAPVLGSGCGSAGGGPTLYANGGNPPNGAAQGTDGLTLPKQTSVVWPRGSVQDVGMAAAANHAGGYSYRLCKNVAGQVSESCFQQTQLRFAEDSQYIVYADGRWSKIPLVKVSNGTYPEGSEWARFPVPSCLQCNPAEACGALLEPISGGDQGNAWNLQVNCNAACAGSTISKAGGSCPGGTQFEEPMEKLSGFGKSLWDWSVVDRVEVPSDLEPGEYLLSWRWDCEQSDQVFQNCADVRVTIDDANNEVSRIVMDPAKKVDTYTPTGYDGCDGLYEACDDKKKADSGKGGDGDSVGDSCLALGAAQCGKDARCAPYLKDGKSYCWINDDYGKKAEPEPEPEPTTGNSSTTATNATTATADSTASGSGALGVCLPALVVGIHIVATSVFFKLPHW
eukprot:TRINITY_DN50455_c0_g1_i1.p1 TRINITY_DN50455_c0_g1~~TRINITY_DN50455_c0_g1_i1.p1  ORF type:complete len:515 (+),score=73.64 TRINITY_DN50455_c0_g1_i1:95-1546(+)